MGRKSKAKFTMKGHTLPGINQRSETENMKDGRSPSSAFQMQEVGDSPNKLKFGKFLGKAANIMTGGLAGAIGKGIKGDWKGAGKSLLTGGLAGSAEKPPMPGGGGGDDASAGAELLKEEAKAEMAEGGA